VAEDRREEQAREALERVARDSETIGASSLARTTRRLTDHFVGRDAVGTAEGGRTDPVELWGRRIGRALAVLAFVLLSLWLLVQLRML
jgi:hypothetical protein